MPSRIRRISRSITGSCCLCSASASFAGPWQAATRRRRDASRETAVGWSRQSAPRPLLLLLPGVRRTSVPSRKSESHLSAFAGEEAACDYRRLWKWAELLECEGIDAFRILQPTRGCGCGNDDDTSPSPGEGIRGLFATEDSHFEAGDYMLAIPFTAALLVRDSCVADGGSVGLPDVSSSSCLDADVRDGYSFWATFCTDAGSAHYQPYLSALPLREGPHFDPTPDFWPEHDVRQLQVPRLVDETLRRQRDMEELAGHHEQRHRTERGESRRLSLADLQWAVWVVRTRGFTTLQLRPTLLDNQDEDPTRSDEKGLRDTMTSDNQVRTRTFLIPIIDMANHSDRPNAVLEVVEVPGSYEESFFALRALSPISPGDEITLQYGTGHETSLDLLSKYGFLPRNGAPGDSDLDWDLVNPQWTTTLDDDREWLAGTAGSDAMRTVLTLRVALKELQEQSSRGGEL